MARERTMYVPHTGSFTSSSRDAAPPSRGRPKRSSAPFANGQRTTASTMTMASRSRPRIGSAARLGPDRQRAEKVSVLLGEIERVPAVRLARAREEDAGFRAASQDLLHRFPRGQ